jgi:hypothetical protein
VRSGLQSGLLTARLVPVEPRVLTFEFFTYTDHSAMRSKAVVRDAMQALGE